MVGCKEFIVHHATLIINETWILIDFYVEFFSHGSPFPLIHWNNLFPGRRPNSISLPLLMMGNGVLLVRNNCFTDVDATLYLQIVERFWTKRSLESKVQQTFYNGIYRPFLKYQNIIRHFSSTRSWIWLMCCLLFDDDGRSSLSTTC